MVRELFAVADTELTARAVAAGVPVSRVTEKALESLTETVAPQGVVAVCDRRDTSLSAVLTDPPRLLAALAEVRDPGNAGTVLRTADAAGAGAVWFTDRSVDPYNGKCVRASAGSLFHVDVAVGGTALAGVAELRAAGLQLFAAAAGGESDRKSVV